MRADELTVTTRDLAKILGVGERYVHELAGRDVLTRAGRGSWNLPTVIQEWVAYRERSVAGPKENLVLAEERARLTKAKADREELKAAQDRGDLIPTADLDRVLADVLLPLRASILAMPHAIAPKLVAEDLDSIHSILEQEIGRKLEELAAMPVAFASEEVRKPADQVKKKKTPAKRRAARRAVSGRTS